MIYGVGTDISDVRRFVKWVRTPSLISRFFNERERQETGTEAFLSQHYAVRFAAKEAFSKALGTGLSGFDLRDVFILKNEDGKPELHTSGTASEVLEARCGKNARVCVSLSHEKEFAVAFVVIEV